MKKLLACILMTIIMAFAGTTQGHETEKFKHMKGSSGAIVGQRWCIDGVELWWQDLEGDDLIVDTCTFAIFTHDIYHIYRVPAVNNDCSCDMISNDS